MDRVLTLPDSAQGALSIRAKALVFHDPGSMNLLNSVERIARSDATVMVIGETGTGKELIARHIHSVSGRSGPFIAVNCGAFSESLIDAELFGHEAGAFTGASQARSGWFEAANGGTLFLDEIGDLPMPLQVKLLRVLQERQVVRLGSRRPIQLDVRLVAATNIDLGRAVEAQHFRADLYYRLSVATVQLPALRQRPGDILPLARHFVSFYRARLKLGEVQLSDDAQAALLAYGWPGNIRELENAIHYALIVCRDDVIRAEDLRLVPLSSHAASTQDKLVVGGLASIGNAEHSIDVTRDSSVESSGKAEADLTSSDPFSTLLASWQRLLQEPRDSLLETLEAALIEAAYDHAGRNQVKTAKLLGVSRNVLRTYLKRHGLLAASEEVVAEWGATVP